MQSESSGFQVYPHFSAVNGAAQSRHASLDSTVGLVQRALKDVHPTMCRLSGIGDFSPTWKQILTGQHSQKLMQEPCLTKSEERTIYVYHCANYGGINHIIMI